MKNATAVASSVPSSTCACVVSAALSAQVNCVQAHHTSQKTRIDWPTASGVIPSCSSATTCVTENTKTRSKNSSTNVTGWFSGDRMERSVDMRLDGSRGLREDLASATSVTHLVHGEHAALGVQALRDPVAAGNLHRAVDHLPAVLLHLVGGGVHVLHAHVVAPRRPGHLRRLREDAPERVAVLPEDRV